MAWVTHELADYTAVDTDSLVYLTGVSCDMTRTHESNSLGLLVTPDTKALAEHRDDYAWWAADNACFAKGASFDADAWLAFLAGLATTRQLNRCLFAVLPDVVGDPDATWARAEPHIAPVKALGYPVALACQNGIQAADIPWDTVDAVFLGGSPECLPCGYTLPIESDAKSCPYCGAKLTEWKESVAAQRITEEANRRGAWSHMGRVNSWRRYALAQSWGCGSADGTLLKFGATANWPRLAQWLRDGPTSPDGRTIGRW